VLQNLPHPFICASLISKSLPPPPRNEIVKIES